MKESENVEHAHIKFSTQIIKRLGEELNPSVDQSILELVKNSFDADAKFCTVTLTNITKPGGTIEIHDDGDGMDADGIKNGWLVLGQSSKSIGKRSRTLQRITAGSKGLGRLASLRMGQICGLQSTPFDQLKKQFSLIIDWEKFDNAEIVEDVDLPITIDNSDTEFKQGARITIQNLKYGITERDVKKIARGLILLADPFGVDPNAFKPTLKSAEFKTMEELVSKRYFDDADFHLFASVDANGTGEASIKDYRGQVLYKASHADLIGKLKNTIYDCPPMTFDLWAFLLNSTTFSTRTNTLAEIKEWLAEFGGVHLYENTLRVNPYGNQGNDWLDMNLSRARNPEERPSTNTSIGVVRIPNSEGLLSQKTDRSGFIENDVFHEIKRFCQDALDWMAKRRLEQAEVRRQKDKSATSSKARATKEAVNTAIELVSDEGQKEELKKVIDAYEKAHEKEVKVLRSEVQLYRTLSTAGITAATFSHESAGSPIKVITISTQSLEGRIKQKVSQEDYQSFFAKRIDSIKNSIKSLAVLGSATLKLLAHEKRRPVRLNIHTVIDDIVNTFDPFLSGRNITIEKDFLPGNPYLRGTEASVESIITNLLNNSIVAFENVKTQNRHIRIRTTLIENVLTIAVADNGPGIKDIDVKDIWLPGQTTNPNGTGLGLTIVRDAVTDLGGITGVNAQSDLGGAEIIVELPIIGIEQ
jgi:signal transduction histidine kinase